ncbi:putative lipoprotein [Leptospira borgpetersenii serovar Pomona str. 200901868]|uniref:Putative lipoprotein n=1 Tax=Leptospira borgpetersenii serovar Pomona str. 200901868 TaxID=1192866 RepID=M6W3Q4_LEPBO|nr:putative lipoprotein [Leptospira borgpetersenii serovar Pomona str. 200901868]
MKIMNRITLVLLLLISSLSCSVIENTIGKKEKMRPMI